MTDEPTINVRILPVTPFQQNCSLVWCRKTMQGAFVDPGGETERLIAQAEAEGVKIVKILVTHGHLDHASAVADMADHYGVPIEGPERAEIFWIDKIVEQAAEYGFPPARTFTPDRWLTDGDKVGLGELEFDVFHCPGHTPGHVVFVDASNRVAFVGDVLFQGSIGRTDFPRGNHADLIASIREKLFPLGDDIAFVPGHGPVSTFGHERASNPHVGDRARGVG
ncbi:MAG: MBL fold metallo-hydrolase [Rhodospirillales bacterium]